MPWTRYTTPVSPATYGAITAISGADDLADVTGETKSAAEITGTNWNPECDLSGIWVCNGTDVRQGLPLSAAAEADMALNALYAQILAWEEGLVRFGPDVYRVGTLYLDGGWQAAKNIHRDPTTYPHATATEIYRLAAMGALDVTSPEVFANSAYALRNAAAPTEPFLWVSVVGGVVSRVNLSGATSYGTLMDERPFTPLPAANLRA